MARAYNIFVVRSGRHVIKAFTVKHEARTYLGRVNTEQLAQLSVTTMPDGDYASPVKTVAAQEFLESKR